tara:strand:- start:714 stop:1103 length:390 start_codon:yes stop_codon:yes gene_type:complete
MPRKKKQQIKTNNTDSLEGLLQETYNDACANITAAQNNINEMGNSAEPEDVDDLTKIAAQKTSALKIKDSAMRIKLEIAKLQSDLIKNKGANETNQPSNGGKVSLSDFKAVRKMMEENSKNNNIDESDE